MYPVGVQAQPQRAASCGPCPGEHGLSEAGLGQASVVPGQYHELSGHS